MHRGDPKQPQTGHRSDHVDDRVQRPGFVQADLLDIDAVNLGLRLGESSKDPDGTASDLIVEVARGQ